jgi:hypothetical protein
LKQTFLKATRRIIGTEHVPSVADLNDLTSAINKGNLLTAKQLIWDIPARGILPRLQDAEFQVFSQFGDDGIIQYLLHHLRIEPDKFIEFGVEDYTESNTRFLLVNNNWRGLVIDGSGENIEYIKSDEISWRHDLTAVHSFITTDNINQIFREHGFTGDIGILSIDIDGNDWHVWKAIDNVNPVLVIAEYQNVFGPEHAITAPYDPAFVRSEKHYSNLYYGASLKALTLLANEKGYELIGSNSAGQNAYFVRKDRIGPFHPLTPEEAYVEGRFRESRDEFGNLTYLTGDARWKEIEDMPVLEIESGQILSLKALGLRRV